MAELVKVLVTIPIYNNTPHFVDGIEWLTRTSVVHKDGKTLTKNIGMPIGGWYAHWQRNRLKRPELESYYAGDDAARASADRLDKAYRMFGCSLL